MNTKHLLLHSLNTQDFKDSGGVCEPAAAAAAAVFTHLNFRNHRMNMTSFNSLVLLFIISVALQESCGFPLSEQGELPVQARRPHRVRTKRCSCNSWDDKECIYFCHLDIIWVNTPSKLLPYGLGSPLSHRRRRSSDRCECANAADKTCSFFCHKSSDDPRGDVMDSSTSASDKNSNKLLESLRSVIKSNTALAEQTQSSKVAVGRLKTRR